MEQADARALREHVSRLLSFSDGLSCRLAPFHTRCRIRECGCPTACLSCLLSFSFGLSGRLAICFSSLLCLLFSFFFSDELLSPVFLFLSWPLPSLSCLLLFLSWPLPFAGGDAWPRDDNQEW